MVFIKKTITKPAIKNKKKSRARPKIKENLFSFLQQKVPRENKPTIKLIEQNIPQQQAQEQIIKKSDPSIVTFIDSNLTTRVSTEKNIDSVHFPKDRTMNNIKISNLFSKTQQLKKQQQMRKNQLCQILRGPVNLKGITGRL